MIILRPPGALCGSGPAEEEFVAVVERRHGLGRMDSESRAFAKP